MIPTVRIVALVSHLPESQMPVGTGFAQLLRGLGKWFSRKKILDPERFDLSGQVGGLAAASAVFQARLNSELHVRLPSGSEEVSGDFNSNSYLTIWYVRSSSKKSEAPLVSSGTFLQMFSGQ